MELAADGESVLVPVSSVPRGPEFMMGTCLRSAEALFGGWDMAALAGRRIEWQRRSRWFVRLALLATEPLHRAVAQQRRYPDRLPMLETYFHWDDALEQTLRSVPDAANARDDDATGGTPVADVPASCTLLYVDLPPCRNFDTSETVLAHNNDPVDWEGRCVAVLELAARQHLPVSVNEALLALSPRVQDHLGTRPPSEIDLF